MPKLTYVKAFFLGLVLLFGAIIPSIGQTTIVKGTGAEALCVGKGYTTLTDITITEGSFNDFSGGAPSTLILTTSGNFEFNNSVIPGVIPSGTGMSQVGISFSSTTSLTISFNLFGGHAGAINSILISGLQIQSVGAALGGSVTSSGTLSMNNVISGTTSFADLGSYVQPVADAGLGGDVCGKDAGSPFTFTGSASIGIGTWTKESGPGNANFSAVNSDGSDVTVDQYGTYVFRWTEVNTACSDFEEVTVNFYKPTVADAGVNPTEEVCGLSIALAASHSVVGSTGVWTNLTFPPTDITFTDNTSFNPVATSNAFGTYTLEFTETNGTCSTTDQIIVTFSEQPVANAGAGGEVCGKDIGNPFSLTGIASTGVGTWTQTSAIGAETFIDANLATTTVWVDTYGTYTFRWTEVNGGCSDFDEIIVTYTQPVVITVQPVTPQIICEGSGVTFSVTATGTGLTYQWRKDGIDIGGATGSSYNIAATATVDAGTFTVIVSGGCGVPVTSSASVLTILEQPEISTHPVSQTVCENTGVTFSVDAGVTSSPVYQWLKGGVAIGGATSSSYTIASVVPADLGNYTVQVSSGVGCGAPIVSNIAILTVDQDPVITVQPVTPQIICEGSGVTFSVTATGTGLTYQWRKDGIDIGGATATSYNIAATATADAGTFTVIVSGGCGVPVTSSASVLTVEVDAIISASPIDITECEAGVVMFDVTASGTDLQYQWRENGGNIVDAGIYSGSNTSTLTIAGITNLLDGNTYDVVVSNGGTSVCIGTVTSALATLTVTPAPIADAGLAAETCENISYTVIDATVSNAASIVWSHNGSGTITAGTETTINPEYNPVAADAGNIVVLTMTVVGNGSCAGLIDTKALTITAAPTANAGAAASVCSDTPFIVGDAASANGSLLWTHNGFGTLTNATTIAPTYSPAVTDGGNTVTLTLTVFGGGSCLPAVSTKALTVTAAPTANAGAATDEVCSDVAYTVSDAASNNGSILWSHNGGGAIANATTITPSYLPVVGDGGTTVTLTLTVTTAGCSDAVDTKALTITSAPTADAGATPEEVCSDTPFSVTDATFTNGTILWSHNGSGTLTNALTIAPTYTPGATDGGNTVILTITVSGGGSCAAAVATKTILVTAAPTADAGAAAEVCSDTPFPVGDAVATNAVSIAWTHNGGGALTNATTASPTYTPGGADGGNIVTLTMTVAGNGSCANAVDTKALTITSAPTASAGVADAVCSDTPFTVGDATSANGSILWTHNGFGTLINATTITPTYTPLVTDGGNTVTLTLTITGGGSCLPAVSTKALTVTAAPIADAGLADEVCSDSPFIVGDAVATNAASISWTHNGGGGLTNANTVSPTYTPVAGDGGNIVILTMTVAGNGSCANAVDTKALTITAAPTADAGIADVVCSDTPYTVADAVSTNGTILWTHDGGGVLINATTIAPIYTPVVGDGGFVVTLTLIATGGGSCLPAVATKALTITSAPTVDAGLADEVCADTPYIVGDAASANGSILWIHDGGGVLTNATTISPTYTPVLADGSTTVTLTLTITGGGSCLDAVDTKALTITAVPTANAGLAASTCEDAAYTVGDAGVTNSGGILWSHDGSGFLTNTTTVTPTYTPVAADAGNTVTLTLTVAGNGSCAPAVSTKALSITAAPIADAGADSEVCSDQPTYTVSGSTSSNGAILWTSSSGGTFANATIDNPVYNINATDISNTNVMLTKTVISAGCTDAVSSMILTVTPAPTADAGLAASTCEDAAFTVVDASITFGGGILWSHDGSGLLTNATTIAPTYTPVAADGGNIVTLTLTVSGGGSCANAVSTKALTITLAPIADAGADSEVCSDQPTYTVSGSTSSNGTILWTSSSGGSFASATVDNPVYNINATDVTNTTVTLTKTVSGAGCNDAVSTMILTVTPAPTADAGLAASTCEDTAFNVADATVTNSGGILWSHDGSGFLTSTTTAAPTYTPVAADAGNTVTLTLTVSGNGSCLPAVSTKTLAVTAGPTADAGTDSEVCSDQATYTISGSTSTNGTILWTSSSGGSFADAAIDNPIYNVNATDITNTTVTLTKTVTNAGCNDAVSSMILTVTPAPTADAGLPVSICADAAYLIADAAATNGSILWIHDGSGFLSNTSTASPTYTPVAADNGNTVTLTLTVTGNGSCVDAVDTKALTITAPPTADAGSDSEVCSDQATYTISGSTSTNGTILWTSSSGGSFVSAIVDNPVYNISATDITNTTVTLTKTVSSAGCSDAVSSMILTVTPAPTADAGLPVSICTDAGYMVIDATITNGSILWTHDGLGLLTDATTTSPTYTPVVADAGNTVTLTLTVTGNGSCVDAVDTKALTVTSGPSSDAGPDDETCSDQGTYTVVGSTVSVGSVVWTSSSGGSFVDDTIDNPAYNINATDITNGTVTLTKTASSAGCADVVSSMVLTVSPAPTADAGLPISICIAGYMVVDAVATNGSILWTHDGSGFLTDATTTTPTYTPILADAGNTVTLTLTVTGGGSCVNAVDTKALNVTTGSSSDAGPDDETCSDQATYTVTGSPVDVGNILWTSSSGGSFADDTFDNPDYNINATDITNGSVTLTKTSSSAGCVDVVSSMILTVTPAPIADAGAATDEVCENIPYLVSDAIVTNSGGIVWSHDGSGLLTDANSTAPTYTPVALDAGNIVTLTLTVSGNGSCTPVVDTKALTITTAPTADAGAVAEVCADAPYTIIDAVVTNELSLAWTHNGGGSFTAGTDITINPEYNPALADGGSIITLTLTVTGNGSCANVLDTKALTVKISPTANAGVGGSECDLDFIFSATKSVPTSIGTWTMDAGPGTPVYSNANSPTSLVTVDTYGSYDFRWTEDNSGCVDFQTVTILFEEQPIANAGVGGNICGKDAGNPFTFTGIASVGLGTWSITSGPGTENFSSVNSATSNVTVDTYGTYVFRWTEVNGGCSDFAEVTVNFSEQPVADAGVGGNVCGVDFLFTGSKSVIGSAGVWTIDIQPGGSNPVFGDINSPTTPVTIDVFGAYQFRWTENNNGCTDFEQINLNFQPQPIVDAGVGGEVCGKDAASPFTFTGTTTGFGVGFWTNETPGVGGAVFANVLDPATDVAVDAYGTYTFRYTELAGFCSDFDEVTVRFKEIPIVAAADEIICSGETSNVIISNPNTIPGTTFTWVINSSTNAIGESAGSGNIISQVLFSADGVNSGSVTYEITGTGDGCLSLPILTTVTVDPIPDVLATPAAETICDGSSTNIVLSNPNAVPGTLFTWTTSATGLTGAADQLVPVAGPIAQNLTLGVVNVQGTVTYTITPISLNNCTGTPINVIVTVDPVPDALAANETICSGETSNVVITNPNLVAGTTYNWVVSGSTNVTGASNGSGAIIAQVLSSTDGNNPGTVDYSITPVSNGCSGTPILVTVSVSPSPDILATPAAENICSGQTTNIALTTPNLVPGVTYSWSISVLGGITGASASSGNTIAQTLINPNNTSGLVTYTVTPFAGGCSGVPINVNVVVDPTPTIATSGNETICSGSSTAISLSNPNNVIGTTFSWTIFANSNVSGASAGIGNDIIQTLASADGTNVGLITYEVTAFTGGCIGSVTTVDVTVNPDVLVDAGGDQVVCEGSDLILGGSITGGTTTGTWSTAGDGAFDNNGFGVGIIYTPGATDISTGNVQIILTAADADGAGGPCPVQIDNFILTINPIATVSVPADFAVCEPVSILLSGTIGGGASTGLWQIIAGNGTLSASSISGNIVSADYFPDVTDVSTLVTMRLITNDPDGPSQPCTIVSADLNIIIEESAKASAGVNQAICEDVPAPLNGNIFGSVSTGTWTIVSGGDGFFDNATDPLTNYNPGPNDKLNAPTTVVLRLTTADPGTTCAAVFAETTITINKLPEVFLTGLDPVYQEDEAPVTLTGFPIAGGVGVFSGPGVIGNQFFPNVANLTPTVNTVLYTFTNAATGCSNFASFNVIVNPVSVVDFTIETSNLNGLDQLEICSDVGLLKLQGIPDLTLGIGGGFSSTLPIMDARIVAISGQHFVDTDGLPSGTYDVMYTFTNTFGATSTRTRFVKVFAGPIADFTIGNFCVDSEIKFEDISTLGASPFPGSIVAWAWAFGDGTVSNDADSTKHKYVTEGDYTITLSVTSDQGCTSNPIRSQIATIGAVPSVSYESSKFCTGDVTEFQANLTDWGGQIPSVITDYTWDYGDGVIESTGAVDGATHLYPGSNRYDVSMTVTTIDGCRATDLHAIDVFPFTTINIPGEYIESFETTGSTGWFEGAENALIPTDTSWIVGPPSGNIINSASDGVNAWWTGASTLPEHPYYYPGEKSVVNAPCFNLTNLTRPMISLDTWNDTQEGFDGVVLQYSIDGGISWVRIGQVGKGMNWYNTTGIIGKPGGDQNGWSGIDAGWQTSRFNLEAVPVANRDQVRLRIAFGSNEDNPIAANLNGFAFDNVNIRDRNRVVLVENFTSLLDPDYAGVSNKMQLLETVRPSDFIYLNYHIPEPAEDSLFRDNRSEPQTRANSFGFSQTIKAAVDGNVFLGNAFNWDIDTLDRRTLVDPQFKIDLQILSTGSDSLSVAWTVTATEAVENPIIVHTVVIEEQVTSGASTAFNVVKKMLPNAAGSSNTSFLRFDSADFFNSTINWQIDKKLYAPDQLAVIVFAQEKTNGGQPGEIYQVAYAKVTENKTSPIVTGINDALETIAKSIDVYPNPVAGELNFATTNTLGKEFNWRIVDQRGVQLMADNFNFVNGHYAVDTRNIPNGIYYLIIGARDEPLTYKKIIIMHR